MIRTSNNSDSVAGGVLNPVDINDFFNTYWEQQPLHVARADTNPFADLITTDDIERLLTTNELFYPAAQLSQFGHSIPVDEYTDTNNKIVSGRMFDRYRGGSTIVLSHVHKLHNPLMSLCRCIQRSFMMRCQTNVYLSPPGKQGFNPHFDTHDVFILQVSGTKTFNFYSGGASFPTSSDRFNKDIHKVGDKTEEITLSEGDTLYIPRGFVHDAVADSLEPSLHITLGVYPILMHELASELIQIGIESDVHLRRSVSSALWRSTANSDDKSTLRALEKSLKPLISDEGLQMALSRLQDEFALDATPHHRGVLSSSPERSSQNVDNARINHESILQLQRSGDTLTVRSFGAVLEFIEPYATAIECLYDQPTASVHNISELSDAQKAALVEKLGDSNLLC